MASEKDLEDVRLRIDELDEQIQALINERAECAEQVARIKREMGDKGEDYYRPEREAQILRKYRDRNKGPLSDSEIVRLFREIISACLAHERPMTIAYLGPEGTFTQAATMKHFGHSINTLALDAIDVVFREVESGNANYGVVPIENSTEGVVNHTLDMFLRSPLQICSEIELRVEHHLLANTTSLQGIREVYAHHQAIAQCREWLETNLPDVRHVVFSSNAEAARIAKDVEGAAAIASEAAAERYGLESIARNIEDEPGNTTRFLVIGEKYAGRSGEDKTSLLISVHNKPGALHRLLLPLVEHDISMTRIESRPSRRSMWEYVFFVDIEGHAEDDDVSAALKALESETTLLRVLGSYPRAVL